VIAYETCERRFENGAELEVKTLGSLMQDPNDLLA
jgi:hypothetical protein